MKPIHRIFLRAGGLRGILVVWLGLIILFTGIITMQNAARLEREGETTTALIIAKTSQYVEPSKSGSSGGYTEFFLEYDLATHNGPLRFKTEVSRAYYGSVGNGQRVHLQYLPISPGIHQLYQAQLSRTGQATVVGGTAFTVLGLLISLWFGFKARLAMRILAEGEDVQATIVAVKRIVLISRLRFGFEKPGGGVTAQYSFWRFEWRHEGLEVRDNIEVKFDPNDSRDAFWLGDLER